MPGMEDRINTLRRHKDEDRAFVENILSSKEQSDVNDFIRWVFNEDVNGYSLFSDHYWGSSFDSFQGIRGLVHQLRHAIYDDGDIAYVNTNIGPVISFKDRFEPDFKTRFLREIKNQGHGSNVVKSFAPIGFLEGMQEFITAYQEHQKRYQKAYASFLDNDL